MTRGLAWWLAAWACLVGCLPPALAETAIRRSSTGEPQTLDPQRWTYGQDGNLAQDLFQGLTTLDSAARPVPGQAESWTISPDGRTYTFRLRSALQWSDGRPIDSADFVWSLRRLFDRAQRECVLLSGCLASLFDCTKSQCMLLVGLFASLFHRAQCE